MRLLMGRYGLLELGHNRVEGALLIEPMGKEMHAHIGQTRPYLDDLCAGCRRPQAWGVARSSLRPIELPLVPQAIEMANTDVKGGMSLSDLVEQETTGALWVVLKQVPHYGFLDITKLATRTKGWTWRWIELTLRRGERHDWLLLESYSG